MKKWQGLNIEAEGTGITPSLSRTVNLLGSLLGHSVREHLGEPLFEQVEELRTLCKNVYQNEQDDGHDKALKIIREMPNEDILWLLRIFTAFFHLINKAEQLEITAINRRRETMATPETPRAESIAQGISQMQEAGYSLEAVLETLAQMDIQPTLTAHPTEARRRAILFKQNDISRCMEAFQRSDLTDNEREALIEEVYQLISLLMVTDEIRAGAINGQRRGAARSLLLQHLHLGDGAPHLPRHPQRAAGLLRRVPGRPAHGPALSFLDRQ